MGEAAWIKSDPGTGGAGGPDDKDKSTRGHLNLAGAASLWPDLVELLEQEYALFAGRETELGEEVKSLVAAHVSALNNCAYCQNWYRRVLADRGWSDEKITHVLQDLDSDHLSMKDRSVLKYADKITRNPQAMTADDVDLLRQAGLDDRAILEAAAITGFYNYVSRLANALGVIEEP